MSERRPVLGVDLDDVVADLREGFRRFVSAELGVRLPRPQTWDFSEWELDGEITDWLAEFAETGGYQRLPVLEGAVEALRAISDADIRIRIITHRLFIKGHHQTLAGDTVMWLERVGVPYWDLCFMRDKAEVMADIYIDDAPHNLEELSKTGKLVIAMDQPYNQGCPGVRAYSWEDVKAIIAEHTGRDIR